MLPPISPTTPSAPTSFTVAAAVNGTLVFDIGESVVKPLNTRYQVIRSTNSADASVGTVVWDGLASHVPLVMPTSRHYYYARAYAGSYYSPYNPNTFGLTVFPNPEATGAYGGLAVPDPDVFYSAENGGYWITDKTNVWSLSLTGGLSAGRIIVTDPTSSQMFSLPVQPLPKLRAGGVSMAITARIASLAAMNSFDTVRMTARGWTGVGTPTLASNVSTRVVFLNADFASLQQRGVGNWLTVTGVSSILTEQGSSGLSYIDARSYPYVVVGLDFSIGNVNSQFKGVLELDQVYFDYI